MNAMLESKPRDVDLCLLHVMVTLDTDFNATYSIRCASFT